jgi:hypothetical protein
MNGATLCDGRAAPAARVTEPQARGTGELEARHRRDMEALRREGEALARDAAGAAWEARFAAYRERLAGLRRLGEEVRPSILRDARESLTGDALTAEVLELFA